ncbi:MULTISPECIES: TIGR01777 family oxidoreductase [Streptomyces]|uniref:TIGR01777 family protein n=1 Tax=Streptomyces tsukubensis (strain DSM 42081 / NBRC 108919 / NRRL 18488 / 9993) TaxID=1114943 RepID=A0A7G3UI43_STRT9|nr:MULTISPECIES: TIGR01777 family oxidoreductase [Streptomyces]AZK93748.1 TIGR01777 family protein [Streptomyces tsukubensis]MYS68512.1 TIGR01777 family protein [Streptomyces sp. SID5473]QKM70113.1 TIGR01777 family protein [Streptomyces tsukubensis NRRL18488]TAI45909.1 TIGR01777 family protein [Streptomyces tsukubensis]
MAFMRIAVSGSTGLIGRALVHSLRSDGHEVVTLVRRPARTGDEVRWDPHRGQVDTAGLVGCDAVVNLAGAGVGDHRWTAAYRKEIRDSRVLGNAALADAVTSLDTPPRVLLCGSAVGYYGDTGGRAVDESAPAGSGFLPEVCVEWEAAADPARKAGIRTVFARTGLVVARSGGAWGRMFPLFKAGLGGRLGDGRQYWSFISLHDEVAALRHLLDTASLSGPVNCTAPEPLTNREITAAMSRAVHRPALFTVPRFALRAALGGMASDVLASTRAVPRKLLDSGFTFAFPGIDAAITAALSGPDPTTPDR